EAVAVAGGIGWVAGEAYARLGLAYCLSGRGEYGPALATARAGPAAAEEVEHRRWVAAAPLHPSGPHPRLQAPAAARWHVEQARLAAEALGSAHWGHMIVGADAWARLLDGDLAGAAALLGQSEAPGGASLDPAQTLIARARVELALRTG